MPGLSLSLFFFFNDTATTEIYTLSLHDALPISAAAGSNVSRLPSGSQAHPVDSSRGRNTGSLWQPACAATRPTTCSSRSEEHTSELQSRLHLVCRLLLEKKKKNRQINCLGVPLN